MRVHPPLSKATLIPEPDPPDESGWRELFRYANGEWLPADDNPDIAFGGRTGNGWPYAVGFAVSPLASSDHPSNRVMDEAMKFVCDRYGCANGRRVNRDGKYRR